MSITFIHEEHASNEMMARLVEAIGASSQEELQALLLIVADHRDRMSQVLGGVQIDSDEGPVLRHNMLTPAIDAIMSSVVANDAQKPVASSATHLPHPKLS